MIAGLSGSIPGLYHLPGAIPAELQHSLTESFSLSSFPNSTNQVMLFGLGSFPPALAQLISQLPQILAPIPNSVRAAFLDSTLPSQAIINLYPTGSGISPHVDLPHRYGPVIVGVSLLAPVAFEFRRQGHRTRTLWLRPGDVYVLSGEARDEWEHGIVARETDLVEEADGDGVREVKRRLRMSVTLRTVKEGGLVVGEDTGEAVQAAPT